MSGSQSESVCGGSPWRTLIEQSNWDWSKIQIDPAIDYLHAGFPRPGNRQPAG